MDPAQGSIVGTASVHLKNYKVEADLPKHALHFYQSAASLVGCSLHVVIRAVFLVEIDCRRDLFYVV